MLTGDALRAVTLRARRRPQEMSTGEGIPTEAVCACGVSKFHLKLRGIVKVCASVALTTRQSAPHRRERDVRTTPAA